jgi:hypothetical protein
MDIRIPSSHAQPSKWLERASLWRLAFEGGSRPDASIRR